MGFKEIGKKIQQAREEKNYSQEHLARLIGCSQSALSNYEKGKRRLYLSQLERLAEVLEKPIDYFMESRADDNPGILPTHDSELLRMINDFSYLTHQERQLVFEYIEYLRWRRYKEVPAHDKPGTNPGAEEMDAESKRTGKGRSKTKGY